MSPIFEVKNISKQFNEYDSEIKRIFTWFGLNIQPTKTHHILKHISFSIKQGESVGIIGQNGAGKSTLLKIITGTLKPTEGQIIATGRISAILELGMGFHPDLTGRQNVYHAAGLMGFIQAQIDAVINEVEAFAEVGEYFDQPVRSYSSGMQMRVAFAVATMYRPDILIIDEALSVGDTYFQHKSFDRIRQFQKQGTTLLLVSHDRGAIQAICDRAILLEKGSIIKDGDPEEVMDYYNALIAQKENTTIKQHTQPDGKVATTSGTGEATICSIGLHNVKGQPLEYIPVGENITLKIQIQIHQDIPDLTVGFMIKDRLGQTIFGTNTHHHQKKITQAKAGEGYTALFTFNMNLGVGSYAITVALHGSDTHIAANYEWRDQALIFNVINIEQKEFIGTSWLNPKLEVTHDK